MAAALYDTIVDVLEYYLGPAAPRFVDRQIEFHLHKPPQEVTPADLEGLIEWIRVSMSLLTSDRRIVDECAQRLTKLYETTTSDHRINY
jgi:hypothetical protein